jgi:eukaryotic-like serine/threonine-protein kinase
MLPGERIAGRFEILGEAGRGGMGTVFRARDRRDRREVALKVLSGVAMRNVARFAQEAAILSSLRHPNIVEYVAHGATPDDLHYLVMEWVDGENLAQRRERIGLAPADTIALGVQLARALAALHARQIVHRDLKPSNVMLVGGGTDQVKLVDFGVARRTTEPGRLTRTGAVVGTAGYMSPEQVRGGKAGIDGRADLFALGCVLYECLTGEQAFVGDSALVARAKVLVHDPPPLRVLDPSLPAPLEALVSSLLSRAVDGRPTDAIAVERALLAVGPLPAGPAPRPPLERGTTTETSASPHADVCALLVSWRSDDEADAEHYQRAVPPLVGATVDTIDGGLVMVLARPLAAVVALALTLAAQFPRALIAIASGDTVDRALGASGSLVERIEVDSLTDEDAAGVWVDRDDATRLADGFRLVPTGDRVRVVQRR